MSLTEEASSHLASRILASLLKVLPIRRSVRLSDFEVNQLLQQIKDRWSKARHESGRQAVIPSNMRAHRLPSFSENLYRHARRKKLFSFKSSRDKKERRKKSASARASLIYSIRFGCEYFMNFKPVSVIIFFSFQFFFLKRWDHIPRHS